MRTTFLIATTIGAILAIPTDASARYYPWCASYSRDAAENCGFVTFAQCRATVSGIGGVCYSNPWYHAYGTGVDIRPYGRKKRPR
jgi:hypothetical protein